MTYEQVLNKHKYSIWQSKDGKYWYTNLPDETKKRKTRQIRRNSKDDIINALCEYYHAEASDKIEKEKNEMIIRLNKEKEKCDFSMLKEIDVLDIKNNSYLISDTGNIYSLLDKKWIEPVVVEDSDTYMGYFHVILYNNDNQKQDYSVARLVMCVYNCFPPDDMEDPTIDHIDHMPLNNYYKNLRWLERKDNSSLRDNRGVGEDNCRAKLTEECVAVICNALIKKKYTSAELAKMFHVSTSTIRNIKSKQTWTYITKWFDFD